MGTATILAKVLGVATMALTHLSSPVFAQNMTAPAFTFQWPATTSACEMVDLRWTGGTPPFTAWIIPIYSQPFIYYIPNSTFKNGSGSYNLQLQLSLEQNYVVFMGDATGFGTGGSSEIQSTQYDSSLNLTCLLSAAQNQSSLDFTFSIAGVAQTCQRGFDLSWTGGTEDGPYSASIIPCDKSFLPFTMTFDNNLRYESDWPLNLTAGSRFTVMMNSKNGYGRGGIGGIYQVSPSNDTSCLTQPALTTGAWPTLVGTNSLDSATLPVTTASTGPFSSNPNGSHSHLTSGEIAGIAVGAVAGVALLALLVTLLVWRRNRRQREEISTMEGAGRKGKEEMDLVGPAPLVDPFPPPTPVSASGSGTGSPSSTPSPAAIVHVGSVGSTATGLTGIGAGARGDSTVLEAGAADSAASEVDHAYGDGLMYEADAGSQQAGPLPPKDRTSSCTDSAVLNGVGGGTALAAGGGGNNILRVINGDDSVPLSSSISSPPSSGAGSNCDVVQTGTGAGRRRRETNYGGNGVGGVGVGSGTLGRGPTFRRHEDAGRIMEGFIDLPPLYTDVPRDSHHPPVSPPPQLSPELQHHPVPPSPQLGSSFSSSTQVGEGER